MRRLLLALLIVCLALPAVAVEACAPPVQPVHDMAAHDMASHDMAAHGHHAPAAPAPADEDRGPDAAAQHACIGCVPPLATPGGPDAMPVIATPFASEPASLNLVPPYGPAPPPPRFRA